MLLPRLTYVGVISLLFFGLGQVLIRKQSSDFYQSSLKEQVGDLTSYFKYKNSVLYGELMDSLTTEYDTIDILNIINLSNQLNMDAASIAAIRDHAFMQGIDSVDVYVYYLVMTANAMHVKVTDVDYIILKESSRDKTAVNSKSNASGLKQFVTSTAAEYGLTVDSIRQMGYKQQFELIIAYWQRVSKTYNTNLGNVADLYLATFQPKWLILDGNAALSQYAYNQNYTLDTNLDGKLTKAEFLARLKRGHAKYLETLKLNYKSNKKLNFVKK